MSDWALGVLAGVAAAGCMGSYYAYRMQRSRLRLLTDYLSGLGSGEYNRRLQTGGSGLAAEAGVRANELAERLEERSAAAQRDNDLLLSLLAVLDHSNEIALATDDHEIVRLANPAAARVLGRPVEEVLGRRVEDVLTDDALRAIYRKAFSSRTPVSGQVVLQLPDREMHCQATAATIYSGAHYRGTLLVMRDVTEVVKTLQIKADFVSNASHELRTPLASIRAAAETIETCDEEGGEGDKETARRCVTIIKNHVLRLQMMVQDLLDLSRVEDARAVVRSDAVLLAAVCEVVLSMFDTAAREKGITLAVEIAEDAEAVSGDERLVTLALKNLVDNAMKFTPNGGRITIRSHMMEERGVDSVAVEVVDTGCGIPEEDQERVFERFYTVNRSRGGSDRGTGLGLAIVKHAMATMGGRVELQSQVGMGTTMRCVFRIAT